jgi:diguanylate cyclase (GGDEF)-like protein
MLDAPLTPDEPLRLDLLRRSGVMDTPLDERFERITRLACRLTGAPIGVVSLVAADRQWFTSIEGFGEQETSRAVAFCAHTVLGKDALVVSDALADARFADNPLVIGERGIRFYAGYPLRSAEGTTLGALCVMDLVARTLSAEEVACLRDLAAIAEGELNATMHEAIREDLLSQLGTEHRRSMVDALTRVWNREGVFEAIDADLGRRLRDGKACAVIMADLDHFKLVNDTYGHGVGDEVLCEAAKRIVRAARDEDTVGRYGGEEFVVVLGPVADSEGACAVAERIRRRVCETPVETKAGPIAVTLTLGVAFAPPGSRCTPEALIGMADVALYAGKQAGRNRVERMRWSPPASPAQAAA